MPEVSSKGQAGPSKGLLAPIEWRFEDAHEVESAAAGPLAVDRGARAEVNSAG
jgi:hypothetical protein